MLTDIYKVKNKQLPQEEGAVREKEQFDIQFE